MEQSWATMEMAHEQVDVEESGPHVMLTDLEECYDGIWRQGLYLMLSCMRVEQSFFLNIRAWLKNTVIHPKWDGVAPPPLLPRRRDLSRDVSSHLSCASCL